MDFSMSSLNLYRFQSKFFSPNPHLKLEQTSKNKIKLFPKNSLHEYYPLIELRPPCYTDRILYELKSETINNSIIVLIQKNNLMILCKSDSDPQFDLKSKSYLLRRVQIIKSENVHTLTHITWLKSNAFSKKERTF